MILYTYIDISLDGSRPENRDLNPCSLGFVLNCSSWMRCESDCSDRMEVEKLCHVSVEMFFSLNTVQYRLRYLKTSPTESRPGM